MTKTLSLAVIPGDGIGPEVTEQALKVLKTVAKQADLRMQTDMFDLGAARYHRTGEIFPEADQSRLDDAEVILLGAVGDPSVPSGVLERGLLLKLRFAFDHYVNLRPSTYFAGTESPLKRPDDTDFVVVREGTEGLYCGNGGGLRVETENEVATEVSVNTAFGVRRVVKYAFAAAAKRERKRVTLVHKHNVLVNAGHLWRRTVEDVARDYPDVAVDYMHIDAATIAMVADPQRFDVIVTDNLFGDIITDLAGAVTGGIGLAASGNINPEGTHPSMFEPVHGSAPDIAGQGKADPTAAILSVGLMLDHLGHQDLAEAVRDAVSRDMTRRASGEVAANRSTTQIGTDISALIGNTDVS